MVCSVTVSIFTAIAFDVCVLVLFLFLPSLPHRFPDTEQRREEFKMDVFINELTIRFPFPEVYSEQFNYMRFITEALDAKDHAIISMHKAKGRGQTVAMLSVLVSYILSKPAESVKVLYCTKNAEQANKVMDTLKLVYNHCCKVLRDGAPNILAVGFASRKELCINSNVVETSAKNEDKMVAGCRKLTASWVREIAIEDACLFFKNVESTVLSPGIYSIEVRCQDNQNKLYHKMNI